MVRDQNNFNFFKVNIRTLLKTFELLNCKQLIQI